MRPLLLVLCLVLAVAAARAEPIQIQATPIELQPGQPEVQTVGRLVWRGGLHLTSPDRRFGGYSGLERLIDGRLAAVSDTGHWLTFWPAFDPEGRLVGVADGRFEYLKDEAGRPLKGKRQADAEAVRRDRDGTLLVSFERLHRVLRYVTVGAAGKPIATPPDLDTQPDNGGVEALATWPDGRVLLISEQGRADDDSLKAWLRHAGQWHALTYAISGEHQPTDAAALPQGDLLVLERRYGLFSALGARLVLVPAGRVAPGRQLYGEVIADWRAPMTVDNMEGMAVTTGPEGTPDAGKTLVWLISDDNQNKAQRTLLMLFRLETD